MSLAKWILCAYLFFQVLWVVARIGKPRPTYTPLMAAAGVVEFSVVAWLVVTS